MDCGAVLSDIEILDRVVREDDSCIFISPLINPAVQVGPSSLDVRLGTMVLAPTVLNLTHIDLRRHSDLAKNIQQYFREEQVEANGDFVLHPGEFVLAATLEFFKFPDDIAGRLEGRSSLGRLGLEVHATAGFIDPGYSGPITFELSNKGKLPLRMRPGKRIAQVCFFQIQSVQVSYRQKQSAKYGGSGDAERSRVHLDPD